MKVIYSSKRVEGLIGVYADPLLFNGDTESCTSVYTDSAKIRTVYEAKGIRVEELPRQKNIKKASQEEK